MLAGLHLCCCARVQRMRACHGRQQRSGASRRPRRTGSCHRTDLWRDVLQLKMAQKQKWRFLQKYWHKGAYFQEGSDNAFVADKADTIFGRDFSAPVGEDKLDKTVLPKARPAPAQAAAHVRAQGGSGLKHARAAAGHAGEELRPARAHQIHALGGPGEALPAAACPAVSTTRVQG